MTSVIIRPVFRARRLAASHAFWSQRVRSLTPMNCVSIRRQTSNSGDEPSDPQWTRHSLAGFSQPEVKTQVEKESSGEHWVQAFIALGSNLGDRIDWIEQACRRMASIPQINLVKTSSLWETDPMYVVDQDKFINGVCEISTTLKPIELLNTLQEIEASLGRKKLIDKGPRNIDLDILYHGDSTYHDSRLQIPHAAISEREFVLRPLAELAPLKSLNPSSPWKTVQDSLNALPVSSPLTTVTPLGRDSEPIRALKSDRKTRVMAIVNTTPDSFSDGGLNHKIAAGDSEAIRHHAATTLEEGAHIIDIGGQSTAPRVRQNPVKVELERVVPVVKSMRASGFSGLISVDTYRAAVAEASVHAGADIINDVSAGQLDPDMLKTMARLGKTVILMHMRGDPSTMISPTLQDYSPLGLIPTMANELLQRVVEAEAAGIFRWRIILDPGIGFAKSEQHSLEILRRFDELRDWPGLQGLPWLVGSSRKKFIQRITGRKANMSQYGTAATVAAAIAGGADIIRVHDVMQMSLVAKMSDAIWRHSQGFSRP